MINSYVVYCHHKIRDAASSISTFIVQQWVEWQIINHYSLENSSFQHSAFSFLLWSRILLCSIIAGNYLFAQLAEGIHTVPSPREGFGELSPPPNWNMKHYKSMKFLSIFRKSSPPNELSGDRSGYTAQAEYFFANHSSSSISHSRTQFFHIWMHCLSKSAYLELSSVFSEHLSSLPISLSAYPRCMLTPILRKLAKLFYMASTPLSVSVSLCNVPNKLV